MYLEHNFTTGIQLTDVLVLLVHTLCKEYCIPRLNVRLSYKITTTKMKTFWFLVMSERIVIHIPKVVILLYEHKF
jgi:hypothetical protein